MKRIIQPVLAVAVGLIAGLAVTWGAGENPWHVFRILVKGAFGSGYDVGMTLFYATPLIFTGLSVAVAFQAGLFNIGAEGQLTLGALAVFGGIKGRFTGVPVIRSALQTSSIGGLAAAAAFGIARWIS